MATTVTLSVGAVLGRLGMGQGGYKIARGLVLATMNNYFDWCVRARLGTPDILYSYSDQALWSMRAAHQQGTITVLHAANTHIDSLAAELETEARQYGIRQSWISPLMIWKIRREYAE